MKNGSDTLRRCLSSLMNSNTTLKEIIVVDDASHDATADITRQFDVRLISLDHSVGAATARNIGAKHATGNCLFFTDCDIEIPPGGIDAMVEFMKKKKSLAAIGILRKDTEITTPASRYENYYMHRHYAVHDDEIEILYTSAACISRELFMSLGGFDEAYKGATIEDMEFGQRLVRSGYRISINKSLLVHHLKRFTLCSLLRANFHKAQGTLKIRLRNAESGTVTSKLVAPPLSFIAGIPITVLLWMLTGAGLVLMFPPAFFAASLLLIIICLLNMSWLTFLMKSAGLGFMLAGIGIMLLNYSAYAAGITWGFLSFASGRRYA
ncbi:glycosyltransferase [bacterium]|nr:glycosyltransferase [candidate division CSSED10-310 bacterium]